MNMYRAREPNYLQTKQQGIGLVEILVSLLLLAVAAIGYSALQGQALNSTDESLTRTQAITHIRSAAERMRTNGLGLTYTIETTNAGTKTVDTYSALNFYQTKFNETNIPAKQNCASGCTPEQIATNDVAEIRASAMVYGIKMGMDTCPGTVGTNATKCLIAAWNDTKPTKGGGDTDCMTDTGAYRFEADCVYMETY